LRIGQSCESEFPLSKCFEVVQQFAAALDAEDYETVRASLSARCAYHSPAGLLVGPDAIVTSYRENGASARDRFDNIEYRSAVEPTAEDQAIITFIDRVMLVGAWHEFRCRQRIHLSASDLIDEIMHEEVPGERERLARFEARKGPSVS
jgi:hypothetical protein